MSKRAIALTTALFTASAVAPAELGPEPQPQPQPQAEGGTAPDLEATLTGLVLPARPPVLAAPPAPALAVVASSSAATGVPAGRSGPSPDVAERKGSAGRRTTGAQSTLARIRECESGSDYGARSASGRYGGAYQMDRRTFASVGGSGDPARASRAEQDYRARLLYQQRGSQPWPSCA